MELALVRPGSFIMGSPKGNEDEVPVRRVTITKPFYIGKYEVSCAEFAAIWSYVGVDLKPPDNQENPVSGVTWNLAQSYCSYLSAKEGAVYRLPTEAEWEYAARGGHLSKSSLYSGGDDAGAVAVCRGSVLQSRGSKDANELGIYDMSGNVWEWCYDWYAAYPFSSETDPAGPVKGIQRVRRGGSYIDSPASCRLTCRDHAPPGDQSFTSGFRVLREVSIPEVKEQIGASLPAHAQWFEVLSGWTAPVGKGQSDMVQDNIATVDQSEDLPEEDEFVLLDSAPEMISEVPLQYPAAARDARIEGTVWVKVLVDSKGNVRKAKIAKSSGFQSLDDIAVKLAVGNKFKPATQYGEPVAAWTTYKVDFRLSNQSK
jgi:sulfatase modifying factor 1